MFCGECGKEVAEDAKFCPQCGKTVGSLLGAGRTSIPTPTCQMVERNVSGMVTAAITLISTLFFPFLDSYLGSTALAITNIEYFVVLLIITAGCFYAGEHIPALVLSIITYIAYFYFIGSYFDDYWSSLEFAAGAYISVISGFAMIVCALRGAGVK
ncbi:MAG: zinc-ribbon domain-containing protein [Lachnospiraceae bacterium]|nr:zinc-ribbon domain-containing protein [Lachnospiraceae bacterium]